MRTPSIVGRLLLALALAAPAAAQILDSNPDVIAFYADPVGNRAGVCTLFTPQTLYLMVTHPSDATGLTAYGCSFALPPGLISLNFQVGDGIIPEFIFPDVDVALSTPRPPVGDTYTLGTWTVMVTSPALDIVTMVDHFPGLGLEAGYRTVASTDWISVRPPDWGNGMPISDPWWHAVLWLNEPTWCGIVTPAETSSWGAVKTTFR